MSIVCVEPIRGISTVSTDRWSTLGAKHLTERNLYTYTLNIKIDVGINVARTIIFINFPVRLAESNHATLSVSLKTMFVGDACSSKHNADISLTFLNPFALPLTLYSRIVDLTATIPFGPCSLRPHN